FAPGSAVPDFAFRSIRATARSIELVVQSKLGRVDAVEGVIRAEGRSSGRTAHRLVVVQIQEQVFHLHGPFAGERPFDAAARDQECSRFAVTGVQQVGAAGCHAARIGDSLFQSREANAGFAIEEGAIRDPAGAPRNGTIPVAYHGLVESVVVVGRAVGIGRG